MGVVAASGWRGFLFVCLFFGGFFFFGRYCYNLLDVSTLHSWGRGVINTYKGWDRGWGGGVYSIRRWHCFPLCSVFKTWLLTFACNIEESIKLKPVISSVYMNLHHEMSCNVPSLLLQLQGLCCRGVKMSILILWL